MGHDVTLTRHQRLDRMYAEIWLQRPDKGNALTMAMIERLQVIGDELAGDGAVRAVVIRATGRFFCTGGDIAAWGGLTPHEMGQDWIVRGIAAFERIRTLPQPVIAALHGHALGGGLELALAADLRVATATAKLGVPESTLGVIPGWLGTSRLAELIGPARARHLLLLGAPITAAQALDWGLVTAVVDDAAALEVQVEAWLDRLLANAPVSMSLIKGILDAGQSDRRYHHASAAAHAVATEDCREGIRAFLEKRPPVFRNR